MVASYTYDAWGVCTIVSDNTGIIARVNPFRYRGYYFDQEIGLYYLFGRYYDPSISRFLNSDDPKISVTFFVLENNLFAYAINDPVNNIDIAGYIAAFLAKKIGAVLINAAIGLLAQILGDVLMSAIKRKWHISSLGTYIAAVAKGAWDGLWGGGIAEEICKSLLANILSQCIDMIRGKKKSIDLVSLLSSVLDGLLTYVVGRIVKVPKYIRDIKSKARSKFIKGTKQLIKYLNKEIWKKLSFSLTLSGISNFITQFVERVINALITVAKEMYNELKKEIGGMKVA